ncbi:N-acetyltransferase family protein [uncultured Bacteroides sp.]|uniref:GNAT family N-acetyltransferase n=1 Tax=uncultured Bacteroides sp. TaxID=162156 RepID=UPI002AA7B922|nr:N-acetyltransferase family protein [uncultured Bacteroides sp.]
MTIREVTLNDAKGLRDIYNHYVGHTAVTFETVPVTVREMRQRIKDVKNSGLPYYVGEMDGRVVGYYYMHKWNNRCAYTSTKEVTVYLDKDYIGKGLGSMLYTHMLLQVDRENTHVLIAGICIPNESSVRLHEKFGFVQSSHMKEIGRKFGEWRDVGHWTLLLDGKPEGSCRPV